MEDMRRVVVCKYCGRREWWGRMMWLSGKNCCRICYKEAYEQETGNPYRWDDLDGDPVPQEGES